MEGFSGQGASYGAIELISHKSKPNCFCDGQGEGVGGVRRLVRLLCRNHGLGEVLRGRRRKSGIVDFRERRQYRKREARIGRARSPPPLILRASGRRPVIFFAAYCVDHGITSGGWGFILQAVADCSLHSACGWRLTGFLSLCFWDGSGGPSSSLRVVISDDWAAGGSFQAFPRRRRIHELERAILDNPSAWKRTRPALS